MPLLKVKQGDEKHFADALVNQDIQEDLFAEEFLHAPREVKGSFHFAEWLQKEFNESVVYTTLNAYQVESTDTFKQVKWGNPEAIVRG